MGEIDMFMENIDEYLSIENKIVTYKWLACTLEVSVTESKSLLETFLLKKRKNYAKDYLTVTYLLSGFNKLGENKEKCHKILLVSEENLENSKSALDEVNGCHVYSIQRIKLKDSDPLYAVDSDVIKKDFKTASKCCAIKNSSVHIRSKEEIRTSKIEQATVAAAKSTSKEVPAKTIPPKTIAGNTESSLSVGSGSATDSNASSNAITSDKNVKNPKGKAGIMGMFATAAKKQEDKKVQESKTEPAKTQTSNDKAAKSSAKGKSAGQNKIDFSNCSKSSAKNVTDDNKQADKKLPCTEASAKQESKGKIANDESQCNTNGKNPADNKGKTEKKDGPFFEEHTDIVDGKKRKRICRMASSSESSDDDDDVQENDEIEIEDVAPLEPEPVVPTDQPEMEIIPPSPPAKPINEKSSLGLKRKKRKLVSKTSVDEKGYMVTEKVWVDESSSASEVDDASSCNGKQMPSLSSNTKTNTTSSVSAVAEKTKVQPPNPVKKAPVVAAGKTKQASLSSFFSKK